MKRVLLSVLVTFAGLMAFAQPGPMKFAGPSDFGVEGMVTEQTPWQYNESDTIVFAMDVTSFTADITVPAITYSAMNLTIPSFTIHGLTFSYDFTTRNAIFEDQQYAETVVVDGQEKTITGSSFTAQYEAATQSFALSTKLSFGRMPVVMTYNIEAKYVSVSAGVSSTKADVHEGDVYDLSGRMVTDMVPGKVYVKKGKKVILR